jgi:hypothetical protein
VLLAGAVVAGGCGAPPVVLPERPATPAGWVTISTEDGRLSLDVPPWLVVFDRQGAIFANEATAQGAGGIQLLAEGPALDAPPAPGEPLDAWLERRWASPVAGPAFARQLATPIGEAVAIDRIDAAGTPNQWRIAAYAIRVPAGLVMLLIDGPVAAWSGREADLELVPLLVRVEPVAAGLDVNAMPLAGAPPVAEPPEP